MCGISGLIDLNGSRKPAPDRLNRMMDALSHRGPDGAGEYISDGISLGHRRLSIIDVGGGDQPIFNETGDIALVFNGMIYNYRQLTRELTGLGHKFATRSDTEVIVHGWEEWGEAVLDRLDGFFAFALWDGRTKTTFFARDRFGKKPLYYAEDDKGWLVFASEMTALVKGLGHTPALREDAVEDYFAYGYVPDPKTIFRGVHKLAPSHCLTVRPGEAMPRPRRYFDLQFDPAETPPDLSEAAETLDGLLADAVKSRLISDVPLGAFLSGGVDSSAIVAYMARASDQPVATCSMAFDDKALDESRFARMVAERYRTNHFSEMVDVDACGLIDLLALRYGEPFADSSAVPTYTVSRLARKQVTVALSGDGGDEVFAGYRRYPFHLKEEAVKRWLPLGLRRMLFGPLARIAPAGPNIPRPLRAKATFEALAQDTAGGYFRAVTIMPDALRLPLLSGDLTARLGGYHASEVVRAHAAAAQTDDPLARAQYIDFQTWLPGEMLTKVDRASMANGLEVRNPLLDLKLVQWAARLPTALKLDGFSGKRVLKKALEPHLPREVLYRPKQGFSAPVDKWMRGGLVERLDSVVNSSALRDSGVVDIANARALIERHQTGAANHDRPLWALIMFEAFLRTVRA